MDPKGKRAVVLGGTSGIGLAAVQQLQALGAEVIAGGRSQSNIETAAAATGPAQRRTPQLWADIGIRNPGCRFAERQHLRQP